MALKAAGTWIGGGDRGGLFLGRWDQGSGRSVVSAAAVEAAPLNWSLERTGSKGGRLEGAGVCVDPLENEGLSAAGSPVPSSTSPSSNGGAEGELWGWNRSSSARKKPLTLMDLSAANNGSNVRVAYQGFPGAFSEAAALKAYPRCETVPCEQFEAAFQAVELWLVDKAVLPIENSVDGSIHRNYDLLLCHRLHIVGEVQLPVDHCLMALPGVKKHELKRVLSHPQALGQCEIALNKLTVVRESYDDTAGAAQFIASKGLQDTGAIASTRAAEIYGLDILERGMQDISNNITRFLILAWEPIMPRTDRPFKTSIVFTLEEGPGVLFKALGVFALRKINLTKIESRPQRNRPLRVVDASNHGTAKYFDYLFYIDFEASMAEPRAQNALSNLQEFATFLRVLGSFPVDTTL